MTRKPIEHKGNSTAIDPKAGYVVDYVSGEHVRGTPEEIDAVQVFARRLVEDYGYDRSQIQTRPQYRVRIRPSDEEKAYPVDIAVFNSAKKTEDELFIVVECKKKDRREGEHQLRLYLDMSAAEVGVWFNGNDHIYLRKIHHRDGKRTYDLLPNIPRKGQRIEDIGLYKRKDLTKPSNLRAVFRDLRNHLAGMTTGITRDEALAQEIINILFCKLLDEQDTNPDDTVTFRAGVGEPHKDVQKRIKILFERVKDAAYGDVFDSTDTIKLDHDSLTYVVGELQNYCITDADRDAIGDAFEVFIGPALRGAEGQFFTPRNVVEMMVRIVDPKPGERVIDPACGSGGFLITALSHVWAQLRAEAKRKGWSERQLTKREFEVATDCFRGIDKDAFLAKVCKAYMALIGDGRGGVFCANSLEPVNELPEAMQQKIRVGSFDVLFTNPPFGKKIVVKGEKILSQFELGFKWTYDKAQKRWDKTAKLRDKFPPQLLFLERCLEFLKPGGRLGVVLPESVFGNPSHEFVIAWLMERLQITAVVSMPEALFKTSGKGGTHTKVCVLIGTKKAPADEFDIFMGEAKWCGHDSRGNPTFRKDANGELKLLDEVPEIGERYAAWLADSKGFVADHRGFTLAFSGIVHNILVPRYYNPEIKAEIARLSRDYEFVTIGELVKKKAISLDTGIEIGKMAYGTGVIPFIRTSDFSNWEIKADFKHGVSQEIYDSLKSKVDVQAGDLLIVKDGTYLVGSSAIVTEHDLPMLFQSHIYRMRVLKGDLIDPWLLFALLNTPVVRLQVRAKQFTQDIIDTLGKRLLEIAVPIPRDKARATKISQDCKRIIETRIKLRVEASTMVASIGDVLSIAE
ncbi:MAG TPA: N-6 DNA methylase [Planctomycetota bacterium]|nr:N-6 DNA methylase [Planctomycetota bacterium]